MRHWTQLNQSAIESVEAAMNGGDRPPKFPNQSRIIKGIVHTYEEDFPHFAHLSRGFDKRTAMLEAQNHRCAYCGVRFSDDRRDNSCATIDEVVPRVAGGYAIWSNQVMACLLCNQGRGAMYARQYFQRVQWMGREKANKWARKRQSKRDAERRTRINYAMAKTVSEAFAA